MKKVILLFVILFFYTGLIFSQPFRSALGAGAEFTATNYYATGASFKLFFSKKSAVEMTALFSGSGYYLSLLYQFHFPLDKKQQWYGYVGAGAFNVYYPRGSVGLQYNFIKIPLNVAFDWRPFYEWRVDDDVTDSGLKHFGMSIRYVLKK